ncbi:uncharacterized protein EV420DRAFT_1488609, partial [Desarmillaria tabescens]
MAITITLSEDTVQHLVESVTTLINAEESRGRDASHYRALLSGLNEGMSLNRNCDEIGSAPLPFHAHDAIAHGDGTFGDPGHNSQGDMTLVYPSLSSDVVDSPIDSHNDNLEYTLSPIQPPLSPLDSTDSDFEDEKNRIRDWEEVTVFGASSSPSPVMPPQAFNNFGGGVSDCESTNDKGILGGTEMLNPISHSRPVEELGAAVHDPDPDPPAPRRIHLLDDSADAPPTKRPRVSVPDDDYDPDDSDGDLDGFVVEARLPGECEKRKGDRKQKTTSRRKKQSSGGCKSKGAKRVVTWTDSLTLPPPSPDSLQLLTRLSTVSSEQRTVEALGRITRHLMQPPKEKLEWNDTSLVAIARRCKILHEMEGLHDYKLMLSYLQLTVQGSPQEETGFPQYGRFCQRGRVIPSTFRSWYSIGTSLVYLAAAVLEAPWFKISFWNDSTGQWQLHHFLSVEINQKSLDEVQVNLWTEFMTQFIPPCPACPNLSHCTPYRKHRKTKFHVPTNRCPFNTAEAPHWTAVERSKAVGAVPVTSLLELENTLNDFYDSNGEKKDPDSYILVDSNICKG